MATVLLVRHGRTTANASGVLAGRTAGVRLDAVGRTQAERTAERIAAVPVVAVVTSPLERCRQTARVILDRQPGDPASSVERAITEADYGDWQGRTLADLSKEPLWRTVQANPSAVVFPGGESMQTMQSRAVAAIRRIDAAVEAEHGPGAVWVAVSHGDIIKSVLADAFGMHLDLFQRIGVGPASVSIVRYGEHRPEVVATNTESGDLGWLASAPAPGGDAAVGGGAGHQAAPGTTTTAPGPAGA
ncbi:MULTISPECIES: MSMEG_4193 family putative phosphomutase [unclassified Curtobacterium]|uniref:MSMEG_4193 family putative phosphomutase n=1 Tax=unclassified Curtobacterium TaxID=257496 RepID=UPI0008DD999E|nr:MULTISPECIES: MSMEG_4193 family putative phosphomutase [unclassified Curtobacterium]OIH92943.1 histidine phosphatase [Curtobacterium sp. MCBA15_003]OII29856.1 histidine phosphatase [Curtobacterium sp. MMLR14_006]